MCNWNIFLYQCGCFQMRLKSPCHHRRPQVTANCNEIQQVREEWVYNQEKICENCKGRQDKGEKIDTPTVKWEDLEKRAYQIAKDYANLGQFPT
ncbi:hypothetical protein FSARC_12951 [Fusarium sarcochroum]|uniref:Uncharacterized protein n=1 Tax=Fusarium sarcochroum TaxID=1208366 RepID=A0A8H4WUW9_9HYPO|nr:hypothetical protein FSARC_12951 [Fusarium sarcochroum]